MHLTRLALTDFRSYTEAVLSLGAADGARRVTVWWPSGAKQEFANLPGGRWWRLHEGKQLPERVVPHTPR